MGSMSTPRSFGLSLRWREGVRTALILSLVIFHLYTAYFGSIEAYLQRSFHLTLVMLLGFLVEVEQTQSWRRWLSYGWFIAITAAQLYVFIGYDSFANRVGNPTQFDQIAGAVVLIGVLYMTQRRLGWPLVLVALLFVSQSLFGEYFPGFLRAPSLPLRKVLDIMFMETFGLYSIPLAVMASYLFLYLIFSSLLEQSGAISFFKDLSYSLVGGRRGGPAQVAVVSSSLMGTVSGSPVANVVTTGAFTIPLMKQYKFSPAFAGAVEAVASTGGALMPPVMGTTAFLIAEFMGVSYWSVVKAAIIPAVLYYVALFLAIDFRAARTGLHGLARAELPPFWSVMRSRGYLLIPILVLLLMLGLGYSAGRVGLFATFSLLAVLLIQRKYPFSSIDLLEAFRAAGRTTITVTMATAAAGIISGAVFVSGLGTMIAELVVTLSGGHLLIALFLTAIVAMILGMGLPAPAVYVTLTVTITPALIRMGVDPMGAHLFMLFFGMISGITPPVAVTAYAAAGLAKANASETGWLALRLGFAALLLPFLWIYHPSLLMMGPPVWVLWSTITATLGIAAIAAAFEGWLITNLTLTLRIQLIVAGLLSVYPESISDLIGLAWFGLLIFLGYQRRRKAQLPVSIGLAERR